MLEKVLSIFQEKNKVKEIYDKNEFERFNPIDSIEDGYIVSKDGMVYKGFRLFEPGMESLNGEMIDNMAKGIGDAIKDLPPGTVIHKQGIFRNIFKNQVDNGDSFEGSKYFDFHKKKHLLEKPVLDYQCFLYIGLPANNQVIRKKPSPVSTFFSTPLVNLKNQFSNISRVLKNYDKTVNSFLVKLGGLGVKNNPCSNEELIKNFYRYFNLEFSKEGEDGIKNNYLNKQPYLQIGGKMMGMCSYGGFPREINSGARNEYGVISPFNYPLYHGLKFPHLVNEFIVIPDQDNIMSDIEQLQERFGASKEEVISNNIEVFKDDVIGLKELLVYYGSNITYWGKELDEISFYESEVIKAFKNFGNPTVSVETIEDSCNLFWSNVPGAVHQNYRRSIFSSVHVGCMFGFNGEYYDQGNFLVVGRNNRPVFIDIDGKVGESQNFVVVGPTGSGKSFTMNIIVSYFREMGHEVLIVDKGGSYQQLCKILGGAYYDLEEVEELNLNFFIVPKDDFGKYELSENKIKGIKGVLKIIWKEDNKGRLKRSEETILIRIIKLYYQHLEENKSVFPKMDSFLKFLKKLDMQEVGKSLGFLLRSRKNILISMVLF